MPHAGLLNSKQITYSINPATSDEDTDQGSSLLEPHSRLVMYVSKSVLPPLPHNQHRSKVEGREIQINSVSEAPMVPLRPLSRTHAHEEVLRRRKSCLMRTVSAGGAALGRRTDGGRASSATRRAT